MNYRPEYRHEWGNKTYYTQLRLDPLGQESAQELLTALLGADPTLQPLKQIILAKTEGNPFFMEEIIQALFEQGALIHDPVVGAKLRPGSSTGHSPSVDRSSPDATDLHIPPTVQAVLASRIDRLPAEEKALLQTLAVIGKEFPLSLLKQVANDPEEELHRSLSHLQAAEFIYEQPAFPEVEYTFKHALTQEVSYNSLLIERRKALHEQTARAIEVMFHSQLEDHYGDLAHHYTRSGNTQKAVEYLRLAGQQAVQQSANGEAVSHFTAALELLKTLPDTSAHLQQELALYVALGPPLQATKGFAAPDVGSVYERARELCRQVGESPQLGRVLWGLWQFYFARADTKTARELGEQFLNLAQRLQDPVLLVTAHRSLGTALLACGELTPARTLLEQGVALYNPRQHGTFLSSYGVDVGVMCLSSAAQALWYLGYVDQAVKKSREALTLARELSHPFSLATALMFASQSEVRRREYETTREGVEALLALCSEQGFSLWSAWGTVLRGWVLARQGREEEGITLICQGLAAVRATGAAAGVPTFLAYLAETYGQVGRPEEGLSTLAEALALVHKNGDRMHEAELYRLKGELTLQSKVSGPKFKVTQEAERCFLKALEIARRQSAKSLELRAAMSLSRLWQKQGKKAEARQLLADIYNWFTEGFDTADLQEAKALLEELV